MESNIVATSNPELTENTVFPAVNCHLLTVLENNFSMQTFYCALFLNERNYIFNEWIEGFDVW